MQLVKKTQHYIELIYSIFIVRELCGITRYTEDENMSSLTAPIRATLRHFKLCSRLLIDLVTDIVFQWLMVGFIKPRNKLPNSWRLLPPVNTNILMQSATTLARRIRLKEVYSQTHKLLNLQKYFLICWVYIICCNLTLPYFNRSHLKKLFVPVLTE